MIEVRTYDGAQALVGVKDLDTGNVQGFNFDLNSFDRTVIQGAGGNDRIYYNLLQDSEIYGGDNDDYIEGGVGADLIDGGAGNDTIDGTYNHDEIYGDAGNDILRGGMGVDRLFGGEDHDKLDGGTGNDFLYGEGGNDTYYFSGYYLGADEVHEYSGGGNDTLNFADLDDGLNGPGGLSLGSTANQTVAMRYGISSLDLKLSDAAGIENVVGSSERDVVFGNALDNRLQGGAGDDAISGYGGNDTLEGGAGYDWLSGSGGHDTYVFATRFADLGLGIAGRLGHDVIYDSLDEYAASGSDTLDFSSFGAAVTVNLSTVGESQEVAPGMLSLFLAAQSPIENVIGSAHDDTIIGSSFNDSLKGMAGNDTLRGGDGADQLEGGAGDDYLDGGDGNDHLTGDAGNDFVYGWYGVDYVHFSGNTDLGHDTLPDWFDSGDMLDFSGFGQGVKLNLNVNTDTEQTLAAHLKLTIYHPWTLTHVTGSEHVDMIDGNGRANVIHGLSGNDIISGHGGDDFLSGSFGDDIISGGSGNDVLFGSFGYDRLYGDGGDDTLGGGDDDIADLLVGGSGHDKFWAEWEYSYFPVKNTSPFTKLLRWNRDQPADFDGSRDEILG